MDLANALLGDVGVLFYFQVFLTVIMVPTIQTKYTGLKVVNRLVPLNTKKVVRVDIIHSAKITNSGNLFMVVSLKEFLYCIDVRLLSQNLNKKGSKVIKPK